MANVDNLDWLNANSLRSYPLKESVSKISVDGLFTIPNRTIVDMQIAATYDATVTFYISQISNLADRVIFELADGSGNTLGTFTVIFASHTKYAEYYLVPSDNYPGAAGVIVVDSIEAIQNQPTGIFSFTLATAELETRTIIPALKGLDSIIFQNTDGTEVALTGIVKVIARNNLRFKKVDGQNEVIIDAGNGLGLNTDCDATKNCIQTINGIPPDENGNFTLDFSDCINITPIASNTGLILQDICCKPCMGCDDIAILTTRLMAAETTLVNLRNFYTNLQSLFENYQLAANYTCDC